MSLVTPFDVNNKIDYEELFKLIDFQIASNTTGILILGNESESESLDVDERVELVNRCTKYINGKIKIFVGIIGNNAKYIIDFARKIKDFKFDNYLISCPFYIKSNDIGLVDYFTYIADNLDRPLIIDYNKNRSGISLSEDVVKNLSYHRNIVGINVCSKEIKDFISISKLDGDDFKLYCGDDYLILPSISLGYYANISVVGNVYPKEIKKIYDNFSQNAQISKQIYFSLLNVILDLNDEVSPIPIKYFLFLVGFSSMKLRRPLADCSKELKRKIEEDYLEK